MTALAATPAGQRLSLTIRTPTTTLTVFLAGPDARAWAAQLTKDSASMSVAGLVVANGTTLPGRPLGSERDRDAGRLLLLPGGMPVGGRVQRREHLHRPRGCGSRCV